MGISRGRTVFMVAALIAALAAGARGDGGIVTSGATIAVGAGATNGTVTTDSCAPLGETPSILPFPGFIGLGFQTTPPAFGGAGSGGSAFATSQFLTTLASGSYDYASFTISAGHTVRSDGPLVIRTTGDVLIEGTLETLSNASAPIEIHAGGSITVRRQGNQLCSVGPAGPGGGAVTLDAQGAVFVGGTQPASFRAGVAYPGNAVTIVSQNSASGIAIDGALVGQSGGAIVIDAPKMSISNAAVSSANLGTSIRARGGTLDITDSTISGSAVSVEVTGGLNLTRSGLLASSGDLLVRAYAGSIALNGASAVANGGGAFVDIGASGDVTLDGDSDVANTAGSVLFVQAQGGDVRVDALGGATSSNINGSGPSCSTGIIASRDILIHADADIAGELGLSLTAQRDIIVSGDPLLRAATRSMTLRATGALVVGPYQSGPPPTLIFGDLYATADSTSASSIDFGFTFSAGPVTVVSRGDLTVKGSMIARESLVVGSLEGDVNATGATLASDSVNSGDSASVEVSAWGGCDQTIDLTNATVRSGDATMKSGDVKVLVRSDVPAAIGSVLVTKATVKDKPGSADIVVVEGVLDIGGGGAPSGEVTITVGESNLTFDVRRSGSSIRGRSGGSTIVFTPPRAGSRYGFKATLKVDSTFVVTEGSQIEFGASQSDGEGGTIVFGESTVEIEGGKFVLGSSGRLVTGSSPVFVTTGGVKLSDKGPDTASGTFIVTDGTFQTTAPTIHIEFGTVVIDAPSTVFVEGAPGVFTIIKGSVANVKTLKVDTNDGTVTFSGTGEFDAGTGSVVVVESTLVIDGGAPLTTSLRMGRRGRRLAY